MDRHNLVPEVEDVSVDHQEIGFNDAIFSWTEACDGTLTPSRREFSLHLEGDVFFRRGALNMVVGPTGSGKTSLLMALLGTLLPHRYCFAAIDLSLHRRDAFHSLWSQLLV